MFACDENLNDFDLEGLCAYNFNSYSDLISIILYSKKSRDYSIL